MTKTQISSTNVKTMDNKTFAEVITSESNILVKRRQNAKVFPYFGENGWTGIAFSGGGVRSACFCLGVAKFLLENNQWRNLDYISSVSGGGYAAAALTTTGDTNEERISSISNTLRLLRDEKGYLKIELTDILLSAISAAISLILVSSLFFLLLTQAVHQNHEPRQYGILINTLIALFAFRTILIFTGKKFQETSEFLQLLILIFSTSLFSDWLSKTPDTISAIVAHATLSIALAISISIYSKTNLFAKRLHTHAAWIISTITFIYCYFLTTKIPHLLNSDYATPKNEPVLFGVFIVIFMISCIVSPNITNRLFGKYRRGIKYAFIKTNENIDFANHNKDTSNPIHIINCIAQCSSFQHGKTNFRGGELFSITPFHVGTEENLFLNTHEWTREYGDTTIRTQHRELSHLIATSGAAIDSNTSRNPPIKNFLLMLFNLGLGSWVLNPAHVKSPNTWPMYFLNLTAALGMHFNTSKWIRLSDGGHFDNLGIYSLVARKCSKIYVVDGAHDPDFGFFDLAIASQRCFEDLNALIELDSENFIDGKLVRKSVYFGKVIYLDHSRKHVIKTSQLIYIKLCLDQENNNIPLWLRLRPTIDLLFPHEPTSNQLVDWDFPAAYSTLGYESARFAMNSK